MNELDGLQIIDPNGPFPGCWVEQDGSSTRVWKGETAWLTRHGEATVRWLLGRAVTAYHVDIEEGERIARCEIFSPVDHETWRRPNPNGSGYIIGTLTITDNGILFTDKNTLSEQINRGPLHEDIQAYPGAADIFRDDGFAAAFNEYSRNADFRRNGTDDPPYSMSWRFIGGLIADIRGIGESYIDFYLDDAEFTEQDTARVEAFLDELGWHKLSQAEINANHVKAMELLQEIEARPVGAIPVADRINLNIDRSKVVTPEGATGRMHIASIDGKATAAEHSLFFTLVDFTQGAVTPKNLAIQNKPGDDTPTGP